MNDDKLNEIGSNEEISVGKITYLDRLKNDRHFQCIVAGTIVVVFLLFNFVWSTPRKLHVFVYESIGSVKKLCDLYDAAYYGDDTELACHTAEAISKFANKESRSFLGEVLILTYNNNLRMNIVDCIIKNDREAFKELIGTYQNNKDIKKLTGLYPALASKTEILDERNRCIRALVDSNSLEADTFLDNILTSEAKSVQDAIVLAYEQSKTNSIENKIKAYERKIIEAEYLNYVDIKLFDVLAKYDKYKQLVNDTMLNCAIACINYTDTKKNLEMVNLIKQHIGDVKYYQGINTDTLLSLAEEVVNVGKEYEEIKTLHSKMEKSCNQSLTTLENELRDKVANKDRRLEEISYFYRYTIPMYEDPSFRQKLINDFGIQGALQNVQEYSRMFWKYEKELYEINSDFANLRRRISSLKADNKEKMRTYDEQLEDIGKKYATIVSNLKNINKQGLKQPLGLDFSKNIMEQNIKFKHEGEYRLRGSKEGTNFYKCTEIDKLILSDIIPTGTPVLRNEFQGNDILKKAIIDYEGEGEDIESYLTKKYGKPLRIDKDDFVSRTYRNSGEFQIYHGYCHAYPNGVVPKKISGNIIINRIKDAW